MWNDTQREPLANTLSHIQENIQGKKRNVSLHPCSCIIIKGTFMQMIWYNDIYMIALTQIRNLEIFAFIAVLVLKFLSRKFLFINRKDNQNW